MKLPGYVELHRHRTDDAKIRMLLPLGFAVFEDHNMEAFIELPWVSSLNSEFDPQIYVEETYDEIVDLIHEAQNPMIVDVTMVPPE